VAFSSYSEESSNLGLINGYFLFGMEWMVGWGGFLGVNGLYLHSFKETVDFDYRDAQEGKLTVGSFGSMEPRNGKFDSLGLVLAFGYAF
ncbi:MAG: hypothetical protein HY901_36680, partial [Deltaproteobacteria bacterium]|nr:hypothetical protein [Deltaproteobacteria bacterium]